MYEPVFPIDGCGPLTGGEGTEKYAGQWLLVAPNWETLDVEDFPQLEQVTLELRMGYLVIRAPGMLRLDLVPDVIEDDASVWRTASHQGEAFPVVDEGDLAAAWFSNYLDVPCRLVKRLPADTPEPPQA